MHDGRFFLASVVAMMFSATTQIGGQSPASTVEVHAENKLSIERSVETVGIPWTTVRSRLPSAQPNAVRVVDSEGNEVVSQVVDDDGDGKSDELIFQASFAPKQTRTFTIRKRRREQSSNHGFTSTTMTRATTLRGRVTGSRSAFTERASRKRHRRCRAAASTSGTSAREP